MEKSMPKYPRFDTRNKNEGKHKKLDQQRELKIKKVDQEKQLNEVMFDDAHDYDEYDPQQLTE